MPWEKSFDIDETLTRAMQAFWAHGYGATSMQNLVDATGVNRASLYSTYGDKRELFLTALKKYDGDIRRRMLAELAENESPEQAIAAVFDKFIEQTNSAYENWGCFIVNTSLELAAHDKEIAKFVNSAQDEIEAFFLEMIRKGQKSGAFNGELNPVGAANGILASLLGMLVMIRSRPEENYLNSVRDGALSTLL